MARLLIDRGYRNVRPLLGGFDAWLEKGFPVDRHTLSAGGSAAIAQPSGSA